MSHQPVTPQLAKEEEAKLALIQLGQMPGFSYVSTNDDIKVVL